MTNPSTLPAAVRHGYQEQPTPKERLRAVTEAMAGLTNVALELKRFEAATRKAGSLRKLTVVLLENIADDCGRLERTLRYSRDEISGEAGAVLADLVEQARTLEDEVTL